MTESEFQASVLNRCGLRIEKQMADYALKQPPQLRELALIGVDARTGVPRRQIVAREALFDTTLHQ